MGLLQSNFFRPQPEVSEAMGFEGSAGSVYHGMRMSLRGRPLNVLLGFDNNLDQEPSSDRPNVVPPGTPGSAATRFGSFAAPQQGMPGNLGRNAFSGPAFAALNLRLQRVVRLKDALRLEATAEAFNLFNRTNVRTLNPNYLRAGEPLSAFDPRQIQFGLRLRF